MLFWPPFLTVGKQFIEVEQQALGPLPAEPFPIYDEGIRKVSRDGHVEVKGAFYSAPPEYLGCEVWMRWNERIVRMLNHRQQQIAIAMMRASQILWILAKC